MAVIVSVLGYNLAVDDADFCSPGLLRRPLCVGKDNKPAKVTVYPHSVCQLFCSHFCHSLCVGHYCLPPIENVPRDVEKLPPDVCDLGSLHPLCYGVEELMDLVFIHRFEVAVIRRM